MIVPLFYERGIVSIRRKSSDNIIDIDPHYWKIKAFFPLSAHPYTFELLKLILNSSINISSTPTSERILSNEADWIILLKLSRIRLFGFMTVFLLKLIFSLFLRFRLMVELDISFNSLKLFRSFHFSEDNQCGNWPTLESTSFKKLRWSRDNFFYMFRKLLFACALSFQFFLKRLISEFTVPFQTPVSETIWSFVLFIIL